MEKVKKDREIAMKQKDALVKTLSEAANALESSLKVLLFFQPRPLPPEYVGSTWLVHVASANATTFLLQFLIIIS
jgi:hypothetical protein